MFAITGAGGRVGGVVARLLLAAGEDVTAVVRERADGDAWAMQGCAVAIARSDDARALTRAFECAEGVFVRLPFAGLAASPDSSSLAAIAALKDALVATAPARVVCLSASGAHVGHRGSPASLAFAQMEHAFRALPMPVAFVRAASFSENVAPFIEAAVTTGTIPGFAYPFDRPIPMVATADVGRVAAALLRQTWAGVRVLELEGPTRITSNEIAAAFAHLLGRAVRIERISGDGWPRGCIADAVEFENPAHTIKGTLPFERVLRGLIQRAFDSA
ncbi:uncharacterized protein YbjT (DUF2867 family) [Paraburkholderia caballeronis]|uniref:NmrA family NAD(P)-binding protein n=1 Tax=Paraburkholderia caballeronis TaxID=416943 RepID=UPI001064E6DE|nr:NmrA family NAD(P)-binding protein [Paraburkholderia caballeronis]TDV25606.1 uncharacterized protein YbjT (DUF2867 family) [Paraburkholderia caballeronis]